MINAAKIALAVYLAVCLIAFFLQRQMLYFPDTTPLGALPLGQGWQIVSTETADGLQLTHLYRPAAPGRPTVLYFHGNAGHAGHRMEKLSFLTSQGVGVFLAEYRGYGGNTGQPTEEGLFADARSALSWIASNGTTPADLFFYGESLGTGVATAMAGELSAAGHSVAGLILEAPYTSMGATAQHHYPILPARWLTRDRYDSLSRIKDIRTKLLVIHGEQDRTVPFELGRRLFEAAAEPKTFVPIEGTGHNGTLRQPMATRAVQDFVLAPAS